MNLEEYVEKALRTESKVEKIVANKTELNYVLGAFVAVGELLDSLKKLHFYNKSTKYDETFHDTVSKLKYFADALDRHHDIEEQEELTIDPRIYHAGIGVATEAAEVIQQIENTINGHEFDPVNFHEELMGDISWYQAIGSDALGMPWSDALERNIKKLSIRYPEKYTDYNAENRDLDSERKALEGKN